ncbi:MAG: glycosyl hydrolase [bacterium]|nr:glycosyl hydrolase [bacterium]
MRSRRIVFRFLAAAMTAVFIPSVAGIRPSNPKASPEARALMRFMAGLSGQYILTGQHNYPNTADGNSLFAARYAGRTPAVWSSDMGFAREGDKDSYLARPGIVDEAIRQHRLGSVVTLCWHAVPPTADEPVTFRPPFGQAEPESLATVQGRLTDSQFEEVLTPGTRLHTKWIRQVDSVAVHLAKLRDARVPVLWRPYHEMNGSWFWWGGRHGPRGTAALYRMLYERYTKVHKLDNLVWVWSVDRPNQPEMNFSHFYPGDRYLDMLALDVYGNDFKPAYYDSLIALSRGKTVVLGEVGNPPGPDVLDRQPKWAYYVTWAGMVRYTPRDRYRLLVSDPRVLDREDSVYVRRVNVFRSACGLPGLAFQAEVPDPEKTDFSGIWHFNEYRSALGDMGAGSVSERIESVLDADTLTVRRIHVEEWGDESAETERLRLDGEPVRSEIEDAARIITARRSAAGDTLFLDSKVTIERGGRVSVMTGREIWTLSEGGRLLSIRQVSDSFRGRQDVTLKYDKQRP